MLTYEEEFDRAIRELGAHEVTAAELAKARMDRKRVDWFFSQTNNGPFIETYLRGNRENCSVDQWRAAIDEAMKADELWEQATENDA